MPKKRPLMPAEQFDAMFARIKEATGTRTQVELAEVLGIRQSSISDARSRRSIPPEWFLTLVDKLGLNPDWIRDGESARYLLPSEDRSTVAPRVVYTTPPQPQPWEACPTEKLQAELAERYDAQGMHCELLITSKTQAA